MYILILSLLYCLSYFHMCIAPTQKTKSMLLLQHTYNKEINYVMTGQYVIKPIYENMSELSKVVTHDGSVCLLFSFGCNFATEILHDI